MLQISDIFMIVFSNMHSCILYLKPLSSLAKHNNKNMDGRRVKTGWKCPSREYWRDVKLNQAALRSCGLANHWVCTAGNIELDQISQRRYEGTHDGRLQFMIKKRRLWENETAGGKENDGMQVRNLNDLTTCTFIRRKGPTMYRSDVGRCHKNITIS